jgi:hypothetical protein
LLLDGVEIASVSQLAALPLVVVFCGATLLSSLKIGKGRQAQISVIFFAVLRSSTGGRAAKLPANLFLAATK